MVSHERWGSWACPAPASGLFVAHTSPLFEALAGRAAMATGTSSAAAKTPATRRLKDMTYPQSESGQRRSVGGPRRPADGPTARGGHPPPEAGGCLASLVPWNSWCCFGDLLPPKRNATGA